MDNPGWSTDSLPAMISGLHRHPQVLPDVQKNLRILQWCFSSLIVWSFVCKSLGFAGRYGFPRYAMPYFRFLPISRAILVWDRCSRFPMNRNDRPCSRNPYIFSRSNKENWWYIFMWTSFQMSNFTWKLVHFVLEPTLSWLQRPKPLFSPGLIEVKQYLLSFSQ